MAPKRSEKKPPSTSTTATTADASTKPPRTAWKTGEQLEWLLSRWEDFITHQTEGMLDRFWPRVYHAWYLKWPITPTPQSVNQWGSHENAVLTLRSESNTRIRMWFHNHTRPGSKAAKSDLRLNQNEKRKLAPVQAYCTYAWDKGLWDVVIARWEGQKQSYMSADEDDPTADSIETPGSSSHIPIDFKLKVAKDIYNSLSAEEKKLVDDRHEDERRKLYRSIPEITDIKERDRKLLMHQQNQPSVPKLLLRIFKNLEDQAGCIAHLLIGQINPQTRVLSFQRFCQGKTESGLDFHEFCRDDWDNIIEKCFREWGMGVFGERETSRRSTFMFSHTSPGKQKATSSTSHSQTLGIMAVEQLIQFPPEVDTTMVGENEVFAESSIASLPQILEKMPAVPPQTPIPPPLVNQLPVMVSQTLGGDPEISASPRSIVPIKNYPVNLPPMVAESLVVISPTAESTQSVTLNQVVIPPIIHESAGLVTPVLESPQIVAPNETAISPVVLRSLVTPSPVLESSQTVTPNKINTQKSDISQRQLIIYKPQPAVVQHSSDLAEGITGDNSRATGTAKGIYELQSKALTTTPTQVRRDSIEGAPDVILSLGSSGYEVVDHSLQQEPLFMFVENDTDISTPPSSATPSAPSLDELIVPSSQQSLEGCLTIPMEVETEAVILTTPSVDELMVPSSQQSTEDPLTMPVVSGITTTTSGCFRFAPCVIPTYSIDRSDLPSWLLKRGRLDYVLSVEAGQIWEKLITTWLKQERRLGFGLNEQLGASLSLKEKPGILKDYFKWHHNPSKGNSVILPEFGDEISIWWSSFQPKWRYKNEYPPNDRRDYSYILAGGKKGVFLLILCLAWWDRAHGRDIEKEKVRCCEAARDAGIDKTALNFDDLLEHDRRWFNIVNNLIFVMELAQGWPVPGESTSSAAGVTPTRKK
ncbi:hypothetical protein BDM02DRAFT_3193503 [Thelephora ganbajun]|uniref:Uncharacterized protein n=1 Tax=Thelephora ganbajun TaxID=370292 RepID=A0ACB6YZM0_THEGA|nr:hypothetical protein BDM02DRAFT_3193503 [Thelephora ganbajun]